VVANAAVVDPTEFVREAGVDELPVADPTGVVPVSDPTGVIPVADPTGVLPVTGVGVVWLEMV
jgi:hypothetical protein